MIRISLLLKQKVLGSELSWHRGTVAWGDSAWPKVHPAPQARTINAAWARNGFRFEVSQCVWYFLSLAVRLLGCLVVCLVVWPFACLSVSLFPWLLVLCLLPFLFVCLFACLFVLLCIRNMRCVCMLMWTASSASQHNPPTYRGSSCRSMFTIATYCPEPLSEQIDWTLSFSKD